MSGLGVVLVLDDDLDVLKAAGLALGRIATRVELVSSPEAALDALAANDIDAVLIDMNFAPGEHSGGAGLDLLARIRAVDASVSVVLMTVYGGVSLAVEALKRGASDFVLKPWRNDRLLEAVTAAAALTRARRAALDSLNLDVLERHAIERALARYEGNISQAAEALGLTRPALYRRMSKHGL
ncbi:MAG TPA: response regulator [Caulobacteraceae bacterium]